MGDNKNGIKIQLMPDQDFTTCDGGFILYKDSKLVKHQNYLSSVYCFQNEEISKAWHDAEVFYIEPKDKQDIIVKFDNLKLIKNCYPIIERKQTEDIDIIKFYKF